MENQKNINISTSKGENVKHMNIWSWFKSRQNFCAPSSVLLSPVLAIFGIVTGTIGMKGNFPTILFSFTKPCP